MSVVIGVVCETADVGFVVLAELVSALFVVVVPDLFSEAVGPNVTTVSFVVDADEGFCCSGL